jgi:pimeloyl-ACP methyl ester carboxylesterase
MLSAQAVADAYSMFSSEYTVYVFDRASKLAENYSVYDMANDTACAMKKLNIENAFIFGASQGGMMAQVISARYPELVEKLVIGSSASKMNEHSISVLSEWISYAENYEVEKLNHSIFTHLYSKELLESLGDELLNLEKDGTVDELNRFSILAKACLSFDIQGELSKIACPVLVIGAKNDMVLTGEASVEIADLLNCQLYMYDAGHAERIYFFFAK